MSSEYDQRVTSIVLHDNQIVLNELISHIPVSIQLHDYTALQYHVRLLDTVIDTRCDISLNIQDRIQLIHTLLQCITECNSTIDIHILNRCMSVAVKLLKHSELSHNNQLQIDWRSLYRVLCHYHFIGNDEFIPSDSAVKSHLSQLIQLIHRTRKYFTTNTAQGSVNTATDILNEFVGYITPYDTMQYRAEALITLFLPTNTPSTDWSTVVTQLHSTAQFTDRTPISQMLYLSVFARLAKHQVGSVDLSHILPSIFSAYVQSLELEINGKSSINETRNWTSYYHLVSAHNNPMEWISKYMAKLIVYTLQYTSNTQNTINLLIQLLHSIHSYVHPSNTGKWSGYLSVLISELGRYYGIRRGREYRNEVPYDQSYYLQPNDTVFVCSVQSICETAMYSKSGALVTSALRCLRHLSYWHSDIIFPSLLSQAEFALTDVTSAHRALTILQALTVVVQPLVNRRIYPAGVAHLQQLLHLTLPGIDGTDIFKTSYTLSWLTVLFYTIPLIEATNNVNNSVITVDVFPHVIEPVDVDELNDEIRVHTMTYPDWCVQLLDSIVSLVKTQDKYAKNDYIAATLATLVYKVMRAFLSAVSYNTYQKLSQQLLSHCNDHVNLPAVKYWSAMCSAAALVEPTYFLSQVFTKVIRRIMSDDTHLIPVSDTVLAWSIYIIAGTVKHAGGAAATRTADALLQYIPQIKSLYAATRDHHDKLVRKASNKLLKNTLHALTQIYPAEYRSVPVEQWDQADPAHTKGAQYAYWLVSGVYTPPYCTDNQLSDVNTKWHIPSHKELQAAQDLFSTALQRPIEQLNQLIAGQQLDVTLNTDGNIDSSAVSQSELVDRQLHHVLAAVRGIQTVLGSMDGNQHMDSTNQSEHTLNGNRCPRVQVKHQPVTSYITNTLLSGLHTNSGIDTTASVRVQLSQYITQLITVANQNVHTTSSVKTHTLLIKLLDFTLNRYGVNERRLHTDMQQGKGSRKYLREYLSNHKAITLRPQHVQLAYETHQQRIATYAYNQTYTTDVYNAVHKLLQYTISSYEKLRQKSITTLIECMKRWPLSIDYVINETCSILNSKSSSTDQVIGALAVLKEHHMITWTTRKWSRLYEWVQAVCVNSQQHQDDKVQLLVQQVFAAYYPHISPIAIKIPSIDKTSINNNNTVPDNQINTRNQAIVTYNQRISHQYSTLIQYLLSHSTTTTSTIHWRHSLMCSAVLYAIMQSQHLSTDELQKSYQDIALLYTQALVSELIPVRRVGLVALCKILALHADSNIMVQHTNNITQPDIITASQHVTPITETDLYNTQFNDYSFSAWLPGNQKQIRSVTTQYQQNDDHHTNLLINGQLPYYVSVWSTVHGHQLNQSTVNALHTTIVTHMESIIDFIVSNHRSLQHDGSKQGATGAGDAISDMVQRHCSNISMWPFSRIINESKAFDPTHVSFIRAIVQLYPDIITVNGILETQLHRLLSVGHEQDKQCGAAEIIAGIIMAVRNWPVQQQQAVLLRCNAWIDIALQNCQADSVPHYIDALRYACTNMDPRRLAVINKHIIELALSSTPLNHDTTVDILSTAPSLQYKRFKLLLSLCIEYSCRSADLSQYILQCIQERHLLYHPYKQVREQIGWLLHAVYMNLQQVCISTTNVQTHTYAYNTHTAIQQFLVYTVAELNKHRTALAEHEHGTQNGVSNNVSMDQHVSRHSTDQQSSKLLLETVLYWLMRSVVTTSIYWLVPLYTLLPYVLNGQRHTDIEVQTMAKAAANLLSFAPMLYSQLQHNDTTNTLILPSINVLQQLLDTLTDSSYTWRYRVSALKWMQIFIPRHSIVITQDSGVMSRLDSILCDTLLLDSSIEVREAACITLSNYLISTRTDIVTQTDTENGEYSGGDGITGAQTSIQLTTREIGLSEKFVRLLRTKQSHSNWSVRRHGGVLGLTSIISIYPYTLPKQIPELLYTISGSVNDVMPISGTAKKLFAEFMRTHSDEWQFFKTQFNEEQLDAVNQVSAAPTYFA